MSTKLAIVNPTPATGQALRKVFQLLEDQFDTENGCYRDDYGDERIAKETGISVDAVKNYRVSAFGKLKPPSELHVVRAQVRDLEELYLKTEQEMKASLKEIKTKLLAIQKRFD